MTLVRKNRKELLDLKKKIKSANRSLKILKDKRDGLIKEFLSLYKQLLTLKKEICLEFKNSLFGFLKSSFFVDPDVVDFLQKRGIASFDIRFLKNNFMGVKTITAECSVTGHTDIPTILGNKAFLSEVENSKQMIVKLISLAELENKFFKISEEIKRTKQRVNYIEKFYIPESRKNIKIITDALDDESRSENIKLQMIVKE